MNRLLDSGNAPAVRLGRAIRDLQGIPPEQPEQLEQSEQSEPGVHDGTRVIDPVTHDPAW
ncbi:hypothetical protein AMK16_00595 [Streptomyces sp. CB00455]|uniref:hypothetical protein n=1 Tax=Streptomyces sp. CB00455 TaxID=1703927 RepID=UPI00093BA6C2|nr:hypothetical protein [Streptomyces sp. CB00455]OKK21818.1 hypothetical protein AMK16_00595 [Streptomyces sp. CB00455]